MQDAAAATYRFEYRGTMELPQHVLVQHSRGTLQQALELCEEYGCQITLRDVDDASVVRGSVRPNGQYTLT